jgi:hypothetical protein
MRNISVSTVLNGTGTEIIEDEESEGGGGQAATGGGR